MSESVSIFMSPYTTDEPSFDKHKKWSQKYIIPMAAPKKAEQKDMMVHNTK